MPSLTFVLPHWLYWAALIFFPFIAMYLVSRQKQRGVPTGPSLAIAYMFWLFSGFVGLHRFYLRSMIGVVFIPVFIGILYTNSLLSDAREDVSRTRAAVEHAQPAEAAAKKQEFAAAEAELANRHTWSRGLAILMGVMLLGDAVLLPGAVRRRREVERGQAAAHEIEPPVDFVEAGVGQDPTLHLRTRLTDGIEWINIKAGEYVAYWSLIAVFVYYYEVIARYVFNSPTNWVHESMFLMFGMQYMICGAYAYREDQHVRVDVVYAKLSPRGKAIADIISSVFFFIFTITMLWTGWRFANDAIGMGEHSFTEWGIQYWPVKLMIPIGAALIALQGLSKLIKDILFVTRTVEA
ncbi:MAG TPA: TRAP transporter small permease subunit [Ferrovibrio sp.]|jgi:TRAP-type mannitol/chloroaromatic compound transport system permease small subunit|uniref:TRAP transporter small permease subunit n=1 Tax=Ferrovibrio sp. TaxID=1917215 RepID=UPI002ED305BD